MGFSVRDGATDKAVRELSQRLGTGITDTIRTAVTNELRRLDEKIPLKERVRVIQERIKTYPSTGLDADKAFYDELSGE